MAKQTNGNMKITKSVKPVIDVDKSLTIIKNEIQKLNSANFFERKRNITHDDNLLMCIEELTNFMYRYSETSISKFKAVNKKLPAKFKIIQTTQYGILAEVQSFANSRKFGTGNWCISREEQYWRRYVGPANRVQYFFWNFLEEGPFDLLGFTTQYNSKKQQEFFCCFDHNNSKVNKSEVVNALKHCNIKVPFK